MLKEAVGAVAKGISCIGTMKIKGGPRFVVYTFIFQLGFLITFYSLGLVLKALHITLLDVDFTSTIALIRQITEVNFVAALGVILKALSNQTTTKPPMPPGPGGPADINNIKGGAMSNELHPGNKQL